MGIGNPNWEGWLQACPNCGGTKKPICEFVDCYCSEWDEDDWYTNDSMDRFVLETWTGHEKDEMEQRAVYECEDCGFKTDEFEFMKVHHELSPQHKLVLENK